MDCYIKAVKINKLTPNQGLFVFILNCILPGWGTVSAGIISQQNVCNNLVFGIVQMITAVLLVGWLWAMLTGYLVWNKSKETEDEA